MAGLVLGKPIGIALFSWIATNLGFARLPSEVNWKILLGAGCLAGIGFTFATSWLLSRTVLRGELSTFSLELPPYRVPTFKALTSHTWQKTKEFVVKAGTVIFAISVGLWFLMNLPWGVEDQRDSLFGQVSAAVAGEKEQA